MLTNNDLRQIKNLIDPLSADIKDVKKSVKRIEKTVNLIAKNYDEGDVLLGRRVKKIEEHLSLPTGN